MRKKIPFDSVAFAIIALTAFGLYGSALTHPFIFDDIPNIVDNPYIRNLKNIPLLLQGIQSKTGAHRALPTITFALNYHFHHLDVLGYRLVNLILHILSGILVYLISRHLFRLASRKEQTFPGDTQDFKSPGAGVFPLLTALIFIAHPIQVNTVTYIVQRNEGMAGFFFLLTFFLYIRGTLHHGRKRALYWCGAGGSLLGSILSKEIGFMLPILLALFDLIFICQRREEAIKRLRIYLPLFLISILYGLFFLKGGLLKLLIKGAPDWRWSPLEHLLTQANVLIQYFKLMVLPLPGWLNIDHDFQISKTLLQTPTWLSVGVHIALFLAAAALSRKKKLISFSIFWFYLILAPTSSFIPIWDVMVEYRLYLPLFAYGLLLTLGLKGLSQLPSRTGSKTFGWNLAGGLAILMLCFYSWVTLERNKVLKDDLSLWTDASKKSPNKDRPKINLITAYNRHGLYDRAIEESLALLKKDPNNQDFYIKLGVSHAFKKEYGRAIEAFENSIRIKGKNPIAYYNLGLIDLELKKWDEAIETFNMALQALPSYAKAYNNLANALAMKGLLDEAIEMEKKAIRLNPALAEFRYNLARFYEEKNRVGEAVRAYEETVAVDPMFFDAILSLGMLYSRIGDHSKAIRSLERARRVNPRSGKVHFILGVSYLRTGETDQALKSFERALPLSANEKDRKEVETLLNQSRSRH